LLGEGGGGRGIPGGVGYDIAVVVPMNQGVQSAVGIIAVDRGDRAGGNRADTVVIVIGEVGDKLFPVQGFRHGTQVVEVIIRGFQNVVVFTAPDFFGAHEVIGSVIGITRGDAGTVVLNGTDIAVAVVGK